MTAEATSLTRLNFYQGYPVMVAVIDCAQPHAQFPLAPGPMYILVRFLNVPASIRESVVLQTTDRVKGYPSPAAAATTVTGAQAGSSDGLFELLIGR